MPALKNHKIVLASRPVVLTEDDAARINCALDGLQAAMRGDAGFEHHFADPTLQRQAWAGEGVVVQDRPESDSGAT